mgnify:CR=1 FL=1
MAAEIDWPHVAFQAVTSMVSALGGILVGVWRWGRRSAEKEQEMRDDYEAQIDSLSDELKSALSTSEKAGQARLEMLIGQFKESFEGIRRQFDDHRLATEKDFLRKDDFKEFREEFRQDMRDLKSKLDNIAQRE